LAGSGTLLLQLRGIAIAGDYVGFSVLGQRPHPESPSSIKQNGQAQSPAASHLR